MSIISNKALQNLRHQRLSRKAKLSPIKNKQSRRDIIQTIQMITQLKNIEIEAVFDAMHAIISAHINEKGSGEIQIPKLGVKIKRVRKRATKSRIIHSPLINQKVKIPGKPSRNEIKIVALKPIKSILSSILSQ